ncbi:acetyl-CoA-benzylalcohol acetyltransferase-like [Camellia sinensis]|uniref:acetyl-CoA-benzylalcohol acetyltransferase-like n=1 Tax=Camellia sinensis TaxID=4442 RepID=UPI001036A5DB|nr:acetyl-CoA-benzylalcohol acetyltransferase-like [Camellia sinensis]
MASLPFMITRNLENLMKMKVEIISSKFIKPSLPTAPTHRKYKLSFFNQLAPPAYPGIVFFFLSNDKNHEVEVENDNVKKLKLEKSLSEILTHFYPLAGKYVKEDLLVDCNDQGVEVFEARVHNISLAELVHGRPELVDSFAPTAMTMASSNPSPVAAIQINTFEQDGFAVGMRISHKITDGFTQATFIKEWAIASKEGIEKVMWPSFELGSLFFQRENFLASSRIPGGTKGLKSLSLRGTPPKRQPSRVLVLTALIWRTLIHIARAKHGYLRPSLLSLSMDLRERTGLQPPKNSFGNLFTHSTARFMIEKNKMELHDFVFLLKEAINKTSEDYAFNIVKAWLQTTLLIKKAWL